MNIAFIASPACAAQQALRQLTQRHGQCDVSKADYVVAVGGDGTALRALHTVLAGSRQPVFAMRGDGSLGFLANQLLLDGLPERLRSARRLEIYPLKAEVEWAAGAATVFAVNEVVLMRQRLQAARLRVKVGTTSYTSLVGDGLLVATAVGSSGYNRSAGGSRLPQTSSLLALTSLAAHHRSDWCNAVVASNTLIDVEVVNPEYRPVRLQTETQEFTDLTRAKIASSEERLVLLFDNEDQHRRETNVHDH